VVAFCDATDVEARLRRDLTQEEDEYVGGIIDEAQVLVTAYLGRGENPFETEEDVPTAVRIVTSLMVARVIKEAAAMPPEYFGAIQAGTTAGPFSEQVTFAKESRLGSPWLTRNDRETLAPYSAKTRAFSVDTIRPASACHSDVCSANNYAGAAYWQAYCTCGADIAGEPIYGTDGD